MERRNEAPVVGYLGFRAEFFPNRCTNCARKGRAAEPLPFPRRHTTHEADDLTNKTPLPKKYLLKVFGGRPSAKNAIRARTT